LDLVQSCQIIWRLF